MFLLHYIILAVYAIVFPVFSISHESRKMIYEGLWNQLVYRVSIEASTLLKGLHLRATIPFFSITFLYSLSYFKYYRISVSHFVYTTNN